MLKVIQWNYDRNGLELNPKLEYDMLLEEEKEFKEALEGYLDNSTLLAKIDYVVDLIDAYCDYNFVFGGTVYKYMGTEESINVDVLENKIKYMRVIISDILVHKHEVYDVMTVLNEAMDLVVEANEAKPIKKSEGKVTKGESWVDPKIQIQELLEAKGWVDTVEVLND